MIRCNLSKMMGERKLKVTDVARDTGLHRATVTALYKETFERIDMNSLETLCRYFNCSVGELLEIADK